jgi:branched-chain amino acid transport system ATP-binding protein
MRSGAGKTTTLRIAARVHPVRTGRLMLGGRDMAGAAPGRTSGGAGRRL